MNSIIKQWNDFKNLWSLQIDKTSSFYNFDNFILNELKLFEKKNENKVKKIFINNKIIGNIFYRNDILYIYESPFCIIIREKQFPIGLILESIILAIIKFIENNSSSNISIIKSYNDNNLQEEEEEEEEEKEEKEL